LPNFSIYRIKSRPVRYDGPQLINKIQKSCILLKHTKQFLNARSILMAVGDSHSINHVNKELGAA